MELNTQSKSTGCSSSSSAYSQIVKETKLWRQQLRDEARWDESFFFLAFIFLKKSAHVLLPIRPPTMEQRS
ncbi:hypothetical protein HanPSC8_Chr06g0253371 [Helianthus annuus]|nr:hypothetical protein HanPSC8_Chr06g0253371 [Helianthus annuus]